ncbi:sensor histidine kinase [Phytomonospora endophytica]|uniref:histidine kinase n=1 Tax=Phytomonospora endophytica TaxID=714109 RepID=A0A841FV07_9ACTN|nr:sensor histidine kinase [Phytomonospora endophytica]MBB6037177.1 signal transduction histidine kinase [Phytomonospora endophytica]GIG71217.1 two-component sensor histidine kinase [Phytomonospora endophytica]
MPAFFDRTLLVDSMVAAGLAAATAITQIPASANQGILFTDPAGFTVIILSGLVLAIRRKFPLICLATVFAGTMLYLWLGFPYGPIFLLIAVAIGTVGCEVPPKLSIPVTALVFAAHTPLTMRPQGEDDPPIVNVAISATWLILPLITGIAWRMAREARGRASAEERHRYVSEERLRMSREVHDVVGHSLAVISMHAGVALHVIERRGGGTPPEVVDSLRTIRDSGREALDELRATLSPLTGGEEPDKAPPQGLATLPDLVGRLSEGGLKVTLTVDGERGRIPSAVDGAGLRIAQEALTNVVRHSGAHRAEVTVTYAPGLVEVSVADDGRGHDGSETGGHGLAGMRERATALGGGLELGRGRLAGFEVRARLPYEKVKA